MVFVKYLSDRKNIVKIKIKDITFQFKYIAKLNVQSDSSMSN